MTFYSHSLIFSSLFFELGFDLVELCQVVGGLSADAWVCLIQNGLGLLQKHSLVSSSLSDTHFSSVVLGLPSVGLWLVPAKRLVLLECHWAVRALVVSSRSLDQSLLGTFEDFLTFLGLWSGSFDVLLFFDLKFNFDIRHQIMGFIAWFHWRNWVFLFDLLWNLRLVELTSGLIDIDEIWHFSLLRLIGEEWRQLESLFFFGRNRLNVLWNFILLIKVKVILLWDESWAQILRTFTVVLKKSFQVRHMLCHWHVHLRLWS